MKKGWLGNTFRKKSIESIAALNLGNHSIKGLVFKSGKITDFFIERNADLAATVKKLWNDKKIAAKKVNLSLKNPSCLVRYFPFPKTEKKRLQQALFYEMNKFIPYSPEEVYYDFFVLKDISPSQVLILLAVAKKNFIDSIVDIFNKINVRLATVTLDSVCLTNLFLHNYQNNKEMNACILDIGYKYSTMTIINKGMPFLTRDVKMNTNDIFQIIGRIKNISPEKVGPWLISLKDNSEFLTLCQDSVSGLCREMKNSFDYFEVNSGDHIDALYLSGGFSLVKGIERLFADFLETETHIFEAIPNDMADFDKSFSQQRFSTVQNNFAVPFGLML